MTGDQLIDKLTEYYPGKYSGERFKKLRDFASKISDADREMVYERILEERSISTPITVADLKEACNGIGAGYSVTQFIPAVPWICDSCGEEFKYHPCPTQDARIDMGILDVCPNCGLQVCWTIAAEMERSRGLKAEWYNGLLENAKLWGRDVKPVTHKKGGISVEKGGLYWNRYLAERERKEANKEETERRMDDADRRSERTIPIPPPPPKPFAQAKPSWESIKPAIQDKPSTDQRLIPDDIY